MIERVRPEDPGRFILKSALRAAIVMPVAFALALAVFDDKQMALFASFGSMALLVFVDFGGSPPARLRAFLSLFVAGAALIVLGTLCSRTTWSASVAMALISFLILFAGVLSDYVAAAYSAAILTFVLPVMVPADASQIPSRLAGWGLAGALCIPAALLLWPSRPRSEVRRESARAAHALADLVDARSSSDLAAVREHGDDARAAVFGARERFVAMTQRPSGTTGRTAALARLIEDLGWLIRIAGRIPALPSSQSPCPAECIEIEAAVPAALRAIARMLEGQPPGALPDLERLDRANVAFGRAQLEHFEHLRPDRDEDTATLELDEAYRLRQLCYGTLQAGRDAVQACRDRVGDAARRAWESRANALRAVLRAHSSTSSIWMRNSLRGAAGLGLAVLVGKLTDLQHGFWIVLGTMSVLRSSALATGTTIARALLGTLIGIIAGGLIISLVGSDEAILWVTLPLAVLLAAYAPQAISPTAGQAGFTLMVLLLFNLIQPVGWKVGIVRIEDVAVGAVVSLLVGVLLWPRGAGAVVRGAIGSAYVESARALDATIAMLLDGRGADSAEAAQRSALDASLLLDSAVRDVLANRSSAPGRLHDLTVLATGASRLRRVARLLGSSHEFWRLSPAGQEAPRLARAREGLEAERRAVRDWYAGMGRAISQRAEPPDPITTIAHGDAAGRRIVLEHTTGADGTMQPGIAIAWAQRHLDSLAEFEPVLTSAYEHMNEHPA